MDGAVASAGGVAGCGVGAAADGSVPAAGVGSVAAPPDTPLPPGPLVDEPPGDPDPDDGPELLTVDCCASAAGETTDRACADAIVNASATTTQARARVLDLIITSPLSPTGSRLV